jgi:hypothetical protein
VTVKAVGEPPKERQAPTKVKFVYNKSDDVQPTYVNGLIGGMSSKGELMCSFYFEYKELPIEDKIPLVDGRPQLEKMVRKEHNDQEEGELVLRRDIKSSLIIPPQEIQNIINWMTLKLKESNIIVEQSE